MTRKFLGKFNLPMIISRQKLVYFKIAGSFSMKLDTFLHQSSKSSSEWFFELLLLQMKAINHNQRYHSP
jgi:hypothetical protein